MEEMQLRQQPITNLNHCEMNHSRNILPRCSLDVVSLPVSNLNWTLKQEATAWIYLSITTYSTILWPLHQCKGDVIYFQEKKTPSWLLCSCQERFELNHARTCTLHFVYHNDRIIGYYSLLILGTSQDVFFGFLLDRFPLVGLVVAESILRYKNVTPWNANQLDSK